MSNSNFRHLFANTVDGQYSIRNYVTNAFAKENINGWATYANTAQSTPVTGTGGSPSITLTRNTSSPLRFESDFLITKGASNLQGNGVSYDFTIDPADKNKLISVSFDYSSSANFVSGSNSDIQVFAYDVTGSVLIPFQRGALLSTPGFFTGSFQASSDTQYRLIFHIATTNALAWTFEYTNVQVNTIQQNPSGPIISDWVNSLVFAYNGLGSVTNNTTESRRVGDSLHVKGSLIIGTPAASTLSIGLPSGYLVDSNKLSSNPNGSFVGLLFGADNVSRTIFTGNSANADILFYDGSDTANIYITFAAGTTTNQFTKENANSVFNIGQLISFEFSIPIQGWGSNSAIATSGILSMSSILQNGTRVTGTPPTALGQYRSYLRQAGAFTFTETNGSPATGPTAADGIVMYAGNTFASADTNNNPTRYEIFVGKNKAIDYRFFASTGRTGIAFTEPMQFTATNLAGIRKDYDSGTGIVTLELFVTGAASSSNGNPAVSPNSATIAPAYFDIIVADNQFQIQLQGSTFFASSAITTQSTGISSSSFTTFSNSPAFTFIPSVSGTYKVYCGLPMESDSGNASFTRVFATSGSPTLLYESQGGSYAQAVGTFQSTVFTQSVYILTANTTYTFDLQGKTGAGTIFGGLGNTFYMFAELV